MFQPQSHCPLRPKTTMRIGGTARFFGEIVTREDVEEAVQFAAKNAIPLLALGSGSNTIFSDGEINALVVRITHDAVHVDDTHVTVGAGKNLPMLVNECAAIGLDLSALTGIPGTVGGAIVGNAGQGPAGIWIDTYVESVTVYADGRWTTLPRDACDFRYRESTFKYRASPAVIFEAQLRVPKRDASLVQRDIAALLQRRIETQPHARTAGSCFKAIGGVPAWKLIDAAGLRGRRCGGVEISPKHANFLINVGEGSYEDAVAIVETVKKAIPQPIDVEMRFIERDGSMRYAHEEPPPPMDEG